MELKSSTADKQELQFVKYESICSILPADDLKKFEASEVEIFEKIDGGNCQVRKVATGTGGFTIFGGSRANFLKGAVVQRREWFQEMTKWMYNNGSLYNLPENLVMFGEFAGNHTITYSPDFNNKFFLIDFLDLKIGRFMPYEEARRTVSQIGIEGVLTLDILFKGKITDKEVKKILRKPSDYYPGHKEGVVIKDYFSTPQVFSKVLHNEFAEKRIKKGGEIDYLTPARYKKAILRWLDEDENISNINELSLVESVRRDVLREEHVDLDLNTVRRKLNLYLSKGRLPEISSYLS